MKLPTFDKRSNIESVASGIGTFTARDDATTVSESAIELA